jgi:hypothetical protein
MKRQNLITRPTKINELTFDELYDEISDNWQLKAERLQARRWRALRKGN